MKKKSKILKTKRKKSHFLSPGEKAKALNRINTKLKVYLFLKSKAYIGANKDLANDLEVKTIVLWKWIYSDTKPNSQSLIKIMKHSKGLLTVDNIFDKVKPPRLVSSDFHVPV